MSDKRHIYVRLYKNTTLYLEEDTVSAISQRLRKLGEPKMSPIGEEKNEIKITIPKVILDDINSVFQEHDIKDTKEAFIIKLIKQSLIDYFDAHYEDFEGF